MISSPLAPTGGINTPNPSLSAYYLGSDTENSVHRYVDPWIMDMQIPMSGQMEDGEDEEEEEEEQEDKEKKSVEEAEAPVGV